MLKTLLLVLAGLGAGLAIAFWLQPSVAPPLTDAATTGGAPPVLRAAVADGASAARLAALEDAFAAEIEQRAVLEERVAELAAELEALGERTPQAAGSRGPRQRRPRPSRRRAGASACSRQRRRFA